MLSRAGTQGTVMSGGGSSDKKDPPVPPGTGEAPELLTSDDLFGDLVDSPMPAGRR